MIEVKLLSVDQLTYSEFVFSLDNPSCFNVLKPDPHWTAIGFWTLLPSLSYAIIDRMLGGDPNPNEMRFVDPLTEIENRLIGRVVELFLTQLKIAWENIVELDLEPWRASKAIRSWSRSYPPNEVVILVGFEVVVGQEPWHAEPVHSVQHDRKLQLQTVTQRLGRVRQGNTDQARRVAKITSSVDSAPVEHRRDAGSIQDPHGDLLDLSVGDIITTEKEVNDSAWSWRYRMSRSTTRAPGAFQRQEGGSDRIGQSRRNPITSGET